MTRSKINAITLAICCGLAFQFQANAANAQSAITIGFDGVSTFLGSGGNLVPGSGIRPFHGCTLVLQFDGNLVVYDIDNNPIWSSKTGGYTDGSPLILNMQTDGNLVLWSQYNGAIFVSGTAGHPGAFLAMQDDCNLVIYPQGTTPPTANVNNALWSSDTSGQ
jgi:hypothetical protein